MTKGPRVQHVSIEGSVEGLLVHVEVYRPSPLGRPCGPEPRAADVPEDIRAAIAAWLTGGDA